MVKNGRLREQARQTKGRREVKSKRKSENYFCPPPPSLRSSSPCLRGTVSYNCNNAFTHFLPLRQAGVPRRGGGGGEQRTENGKVDKHCWFSFHLSPLSKPLCYGGISAPLAERFCCNMAGEAIIKSTGTRGIQHFLQSLKEEIAQGYIAIMVQTTGNYRTIHEYANLVAQGIAEDLLCLDGNLYQGPQLYR